MFQDKEKKEKEAEAKKAEAAATPKEKPATKPMEVDADSLKEFEEAIKRKAPIISNMPEMVQVFKETFLEMATKKPRAK